MYKYLYRNNCMIKIFIFTCPNNKPKVRVRWIPRQLGTAFSTKYRPCRKAALDKLVKRLLDFHVVLVFLMLDICFTAYITSKSDDISPVYMQFATNILIVRAKHILKPPCGQTKRLKCISLAQF